MLHVIRIVPIQPQADTWCHDVVWFENSRKRGDSRKHGSLVSKLVSFRLNVHKYRFTHGVVMWSGLRTPGNLEIPGNTALLCWPVSRTN